MRGLHLVAAFCVCSVTLLAADNPFLGTWKLNLAKSKGTTGTLSKEETVVFESDGGVGACRNLRSGGHSDGAAPPAPCNLSKRATVSLKL